MAHRRRRVRTRGSHRRHRRRRVYHNPNPPRHRRRRSSYAYNAPRRRHRRGGGGGGRGLPTIGHMLPVVAAGVGTGLGVGFAMPYVARWFNLTPVGLMYRAAQGATAFLAAWGLRAMGVVGRETAGVIATYGMAFAGLGLVQDFQMGVLMPPGAGATAGLPAESPVIVPPPGSMGYPYGTEPYGGAPYGEAYMGYYEAVTG